jgi:hypothetical protein
LTEILQALGNLIFDGLRALTGGFINLGRVEGLACTAEQLHGVSCDCKGSFFYSAGGMFEALLSSCTTRRSLIECRETYDGTFIEKIDNEIVHESLSESRSCPHSKQAFDAFGNAKNNLIVRSNTYDINYHGIHMTSEYVGDDRRTHTLFAVNTTITKEMKRRLSNLDTTRLQARNTGTTFDSKPESVAQSRDARADLLKDEYEDSKHHCNFGSSWSDIFHTAIDLECLMRSITSGKSILPEWTKADNRGGRSLVSENIETASFALQMASHHKGRRLTEIIPDSIHKHQVTPLFGMYMHMKRNSANSSSSRKSRRRLQIVDVCAPQFTCAGTQQCVDDLKLCSDPSEWGVSTFLTYTAQQFGNAFQDEGFDDSIINIQSCMKNWKDHPSTDPYSYDVIVGGRTEGVVMCSPLINYIEWRPQEVIMDLDDDIIAACVSTTPFNGCNCSPLFYAPPQASIQENAFISLDFELCLLNGFMWFRILLNFFGVPFTIFGALFYSIVSGTSMPNSVAHVFLFNPAGLTAGEIFFCWLLHIGDFLILALILLLSYFYIRATIRVFFPDHLKDDAEAKQLKKWKRMFELHKKDDAEPTSQFDDVGKNDIQQKLPSIVQQKPKDGIRQRKSHNINEENP